MPEFNALLEKYLRNELNTQELKSFLQLANDAKNQQALRDALFHALKQNTSAAFLETTVIDEMFQKMLLKAASGEAMAEAPVIPLQSFHRRLFFKIAAAAVIIMLSAGVYYWFNHLQQQQIAHQVTKSPIPGDVSPGSNKATLTLSNGSIISLTDAYRGSLAQQGGSQLSQANGELFYHAKEGKTGEMLYNVMRTPKGGQFKLTLPDGTRVWLNASSSLTYPVTFQSDERKVKLEGEAYFEVAHNKEMPFKVEALSTEIQVTGTHFNVNAFEEEPAVKTTLLEGSVKVIKGISYAMLAPGQEVSSSVNGGLGTVNTVDTEGAVAWKNGLFYFNGADLPYIMRQLERWYDLEVSYEGEIPKRLYAGEVFRSLKLSEVLKVLELSKIHFRLEGNKLIVMP